jgi:hypothetical protein
VLGALASMDRTLDGILAQQRRGPGIDGERN